MIQRFLFYNNHRSITFFFVRRLRNRRFFLKCVCVSNQLFLTADHTFLKIFSISLINFIFHLFKFFYIANRNWKSALHKYIFKKVDYTHVPLFKPHFNIFKIYYLHCNPCNYILATPWIALKTVVKNRKHPINI